ncbi:MAG: phosphoketolase family protein [Bacilli bacterium]|jgi:xylulose-5-phosphate/fructose-6-phosphate phosphoketolase|nr:phosphoketolase family protein [Bacilli bacterium]
MKEKILTEDLKYKMDAYWRAANYLSCAQLYLKDNPLLKRPLTFDDIKKKLVGHWGSVPGQNFIYVHLNRIIKKFDLNMIYICGPGHGGQAPVSNTYLEGSYSEFYPDITEDEEGLRKLCKQFSFPGGIGSHATPETPGSINEGGELGYSLSHAFGAVLDNPTLIAACVIGDGEAETGPLATSWHINKFLNPIEDGVVLPILHLNGYKIANPTILARISKEELDALLRGYGWIPFYVEGEDPFEMHEKMASALDEIVEKIKLIQTNARNGKDSTRPLWPMLVLRTPKGWTGPKMIDGKIIEGSFRAHQVPIEVTKEHPESLARLENWLKSYRPEELFDQKGKLKSELKELAPNGEFRMGANPHANGGKEKKQLDMPNYWDFKVEVENPGCIQKEDMRVLGSFVKEIIAKNQDQNNFRIFGPDETLSNRLNSAFEVTNRQWLAQIYETDEFLSHKGRIIDSILSEHVCEGLLEGYILTGRYGFIHSYESFIRIVDSMVGQHAKWLKMANEISWRKKVPSLNILLSSHAWQQDHNGYTHQDPGFINHLLTKKADTVRIYLPPDANCLLSCFDHCIRSENYINLIIASKHPRPQWLTMRQAMQHCKQGIGIWEFASNDQGSEPDVVLACAGDTPTLEILACVTILRKFCKELKIRVVNVVDLMRLEPKQNHPHGLTDEEYNMIFTLNKPIIFAFHGYPNVIHELTYKRANQNMHVRGYIEEGTITTPFDMRVLNKLDRYHLTKLVLEHVETSNKEKTIVYCDEMLEKHHQYIKEYGIDMEEIRQWNWTSDSCDN